MGKHKHVTCEKCYRIMRNTHCMILLKEKHYKRGEIEDLNTSAFSIASNRTSLNENDGYESELSFVSRTPVYKPLSIDKVALIKN